MHCDQLEHFLLDLVGFDKIMSSLFNFMRAVLEQGGG